MFSLDMFRKAAELSWASLLEKNWISKGEFFCCMTLNLSFYEHMLYSWDNHLWCGLCIIIMELWLHMWLWQGSSVQSSISSDPWSIGPFNKGRKGPFKCSYNLTQLSEINDANHSGWFFFLTLTERMLLVPLY